MPDTPLPTIGIIAPGAMGAAIGARLAHSGCTVLTTLERRSKSSHDRARDAGMQDVPFAEIIERADWVLSVVPPSEALQCARAFRDCWDSLVSTFEGSRAAVYVDCNAVNPETALEIGKVLEDAQGITYLDATIIGGPPSAPEAEKRYDPTIHVSADERNNAALRSFELLGMQGDLKIHALDAGAGIGAASALKMAYAGITKGLIGLYTCSILSAHAFSPATGVALIQELHNSQPHLLTHLARSVPSMLPKAYRFSGEMDEIAGFVGPGPERGIYDGLARLYERVDRSVKDEGKGDVEVLKKVSEDARELLNRSG